MESESELSYLFKNPPNYGEPELPFGIDSFKQTESTQVPMNPLVKPSKKFPKRFWYLNDYEIFYSNRKNRIMVKNYKTSIYYEFNLSSFILRRHSFLKQDDTTELSFSKILNKYLEINIKDGYFLCDFFVNEDDERLWISIKTTTSEYVYDITTHFLVLCCNDGKYEWFSLLDNKYVECYDSVFARNIGQLNLLQSYIHQRIKAIYAAISRDTTN